MRRTPLRRWRTRWTSTSSRPGGKTGSAKTTRICEVSWAAQVRREEWRLREQRRISLALSLQKCEQRATRREQARDNAAAVRASRLFGGAMLWCSPTPVTPLERALTNSLDLKSFGISTYKKGRGDWNLISEI